MKKIVGLRLQEDSQEAWIATNLHNSGLYKETTKLVDGIGGTSWDGSFLMLEALHDILNQSSSSKKVLELGCGSGICSLTLAETEAHANHSMIMTDRYIDLCDMNLSLLQHTNSNNIQSLQSKPLLWGGHHDYEQEKDILHQLGGRPDIIYGCEIACLRKQQLALIQSVKYLSHPKSIFLLSFDEGPQPNLCSAERDMDHVLIDVYGYCKMTISHGWVYWLPHQDIFNISHNSNDDNSNSNSNSNTSYNIDNIYDHTINNGNLLHGLTSQQIQDIHQLTRNIHQTYVSMEQRLNDIILTKYNEDPNFVYINTPINTNNATDTTTDTTAKSDHDNLHILNKLSYSVLTHTTLPPNKDDPILISPPHIRTDDTSNISTSSTYNKASTTSNIHVHADDFVCNTCRIPVHTLSPCDTLPTNIHIHMNKNKNKNKDSTLSTTHPDITTVPTASSSLSLDEYYYKEKYHATEHHIVLYYQPSALITCSCCHMKYFKILQ